MMKQASYQIKPYGEEHLKQLVPLLNFYLRERDWEEDGLKNLDNVFKTRKGQEQIRYQGAWDSNEALDAYRDLKSNNQDLIKYVAVNEDNKVLAGLIGEISDKTLELKHVYVWPELAVGTGIGSNLIKSLLNDSKANTRGIERFLVKSGNRFQLAHSFYDKYLGEGKDVKNTIVEDNEEYEVFTRIWNVPFEYAKERFN